MSQDAGFSEDGERVPIVEFDFEAVEAGLSDAPEADDEGQASHKREMQMAAQLFETVLGWVWQNGMKDVRGVTIRAIIACWIFIPELRPMTLTDVANGFGLHKQSLGRWHDEFKKKFPAVKTPHMRFNSKHEKRDRK